MHVRMHDAMLMFHHVDFLRSVCGFFALGLRIVCARFAS